MIFASWYDLGRILIVGVLAYFSLILMLRLFGNRTLSKMNAFDLVVTIALGSILATILLSESVALVEGVTALLLLISLQYLIAWLAVRFDWIKRMIKSEPFLLFYEGQFLSEAMKAHRVSAEDIRAAMRKEGIARLEDVTAVILETEGSVSVIQKTDGDHATVLADVTERLAQS